jgi:hypothetical protein
VTEGRVGDDDQEVDEAVRGPEGRQVLSDLRRRPMLTHRVYKITVHTVDL